MVLDSLGWEVLNCEREDLESQLEYYWDVQFGGELMGTLRKGLGSRAGLCQPGLTPLDSQPAPGWMGRRCQLSLRAGQGVAKRAGAAPLADLQS